MPSNNDYHKQRRSSKTRRANECCINCGIPCAPFWRCKKHRLETSKANKRYYEKNKKYLRIKKREEWRAKHPNAMHRK